MAKQLKESLSAPYSTLDNTVRGPPFGLVLIPPVLNGQRGCIFARFKRPTERRAALLDKKRNKVGVFQAVMRVFAGRVPGGGRGSSVEDTARGKRERCTLVFSHKLKVCLKLEKLQPL